MEKTSSPWGKLVMGGIVVVALLAFGWYLSSLDGRIAIVASGAVTPTNMAALTAANTPVPTSTPLDTVAPPSLIATSEPPVPTLNPQAEPARAFAEPILQAIANKTPEIEDDFSFYNGNWSGGFSAQNSAQIVDGALRLTVNDAVGDTWMGSNHAAMKADDFVVQFDTRVTAMEFDSHLSILWRWLPSDNASYQLAFFPSLNGAWSVSGAGGDFFFQGANGNSDFVRLGEWFNVVIIGRDERFAVLLNNQPLYYFEDSQRPIGRVVLGMNIFSGDAIAEFDNVKYWNLENVPGLP